MGKRIRDSCGASSSSPPWVLWEGAQFLMLQCTLSQGSPQFLPSPLYPHCCLNFGKKQASTAPFESQHVSETAACEVKSHISFHLLSRISGFSMKIPSCSLVEVLFFFFFKSFHSGSPSFSKACIFVSPKHCMFPCSSSFQPTVSRVFVWTVTPSCALRSCENSAFPQLYLRGQEPAHDGRGRARATRGFSSL